MIKGGMTKKLATPLDPPAAKRRGRPPKPGGRTPQVEVQRAYRARLKAAGKAVRIVDATATAGAVPIPDFDPAKDGVFERAMIARMREQLRSALSKLELREEDVARLRERNAYLEAELRNQERHHTNALKDNIALKQRLERLERAGVKRR
jgi:hypothetical protein